MGFFSKIKEGLAKTKASMSGSLNELFANFRQVDEEFLEQLLEILITSDVTVNVADEIIDSLRAKGKLSKINDTAELKKCLATIIADIMSDDNLALNTSTTPSIILMIGVNGVGKTTTIAKLAHNLKQNGKKVILGAADTFRAAATEQLDIWASRTGAEIVKHKEGADPAAVVYDTIHAAISRKSDVIIIDTAGRLHNKQNLMNELSKIYRVISRELPNSAIETLLVIDATTGQNALNQAIEFNKSTSITGVVLTKLDGTSRGGMAICIKKELNVPIKLIGVGEKMDDLQPFSPIDFANALIE
ncbi:MAG: signal recognition particle-docking protein FtsY [Clostridia bacterium]